MCPELGEQTWPLLIADRDLDFQPRAGLPDSGVEDIHLSRRTCRILSTTEVDPCDLPPYQRQSDGAWITGSNGQQQILPVPDAIKIARRQRDELLEGDKVLVSSVRPILQMTDIFVCRRKWKGLHQISPRTAGHINIGS